MRDASRIDSKVTLRGRYQTLHFALIIGGMPGIQVKVGLHQHDIGGIRGSDFDGKRDERYMGALNAISTLWFLNCASAEHASA